ncbi:MAG: nitrite reductase, copper-containing [Chloroflexi bacterium]|nr:nitrite reductase, copper-containing [Chloroflexota bacterium]
MSSTTVAVIGGLTAGIVGGALFAASLVARPQPLGPSVTVPQPGGPAINVPQAPAPDVAVTTANAVGTAVATIKNRPSAAGLTALAQPKIEAPIPQRGPQLVKYEVETTEVTAMMDDGVAYTYWTFGSTVPGPMLRVRQGDTVELTLKNSPTSKVSHSIDLHAVTGPGGGAKATQLAPGESATIRFKAMNPGVYVYHCATPLVPHHIASGMYGLIVVEPPEGLPPVDHEFYVMQGDFYLDGDRTEAGVHDFAMQNMTDEHPSHIVFNGSVGALTGQNALKAKVGEKVRIFFGVGGPNITSSFHVIGEIFDRVAPEGALSDHQRNVQTTLVPAGGATMTEFTVDYPGTYVLVDHSLGRMTKGAVGMLDVEGTANPDVFEVLHTPGHDAPGH